MGNVGCRSIAAAAPSMGLVCRGLCGSYWSSKENALPCKAVVVITFLPTVDSNHILAAWCGWIFKFCPVEDKVVSN